MLAASETPKACVVGSSPSAVISSFIVQAPSVPAGAPLPAKREVELKVEFVEETSVRKALAFEIEAEVVTQEIEARAKEYARKVKLPGFRPGKIPPAVIKQRLRNEVMGDVAEALVNKLVFQEIEGRGLKPLAAPKVTEL